MQVKKIKEIGAVVSGATPKTDKEEYWNGHIPWVTPKEINKLNSQYLDKTERNISTLGFKSCSATMLPKGSVLFTSRAPIGLVAISNIELCTNQGFKSIIPNKNYNPLYIYYYLRQNVKQLNDLGTGTTFKELSKSTFEKFEIPFPKKLSDQIRIATILNKAETLIQQRKESINILDEFLKNSFVKMFSPYFEKKFSKKLSTLCLKITDGTHDTPERLKEGVKFITGKHIRPFAINFENSDYVTADVHNEIYKRCNPVYGDILYTNIGVNLGTAAMNNVDYEFSMKNVALLKPDITKLSSRYLEHLLNFENKRNRILALNSSGGAQQFLSLGQIKNIDIPLPPIKLQNEFASLVENGEDLKSSFKKSLIELENLFSSLSQRAFKGELKLSSLQVLVEEEEYHSSTNDRTEPYHFPEPNIIVKFPKTNIQSPITPQMQEFIKSTNALNKIIPKTPSPIKLPASFDKISQQVDLINKMMLPFEKLSTIPESLSQAIKTFESIKAISSTLQIEKKSAFSESDFGNLKAIIFNEIEGLAVIEKEFSKKKGGFTFQDFKKILEKEKFEYTYNELQKFIFKLIQEKKLKQRFWSNNLTNRLQQERDGEKAILYSDECIWFVCTKN